MSKVNVNTVEPSTGTTVTLGASGDTVSIPSGVTLSGAGTITASAANLAASGAGGVTGTLPVANGGTGSTTLAGAGLQRPNVNPLIINGNMELSQRGTSFTSNGYTLDRWTMDESSDGAVTVTQDTDVPSGSGFGKSLKVDVTTADASIAANQSCGFTQFFEGQNLQLLKYGTSNAENLTLSFWVKSVKTGTYCIRFVKEAGGLTRYETPIEYTISSASTWEKKVINLSPTAGSTSLITGAAGAIVNSNASAFRIMFTLASGTDYHATNNTWVAGSNKYATSNQVNFLDSTSNNFWLTGVQLEVGTYTSATIPPFQHESFGESLARCQRYYYDVNPTNEQYGSIAMASYYSSTSIQSSTTFPVTMRVTPTADFVTGTNYFNINRDSANDEFSVLTMEKPTLNTADYVASALVSGTSGVAGRLRFNSTSGRLRFTAEL